MANNEAKKILVSNLIFKFIFKRDPKKGLFVRDFRKEGFDLSVREDGTVEDVEPLTGEVEFDAVPVVDERGLPISGDDLIKRALELGSNIGYANGEQFLEEQDKIPKELRDFQLVFTGTVWMSRASKRRCISFILYRGEHWWLFLDSLDNEYGPRTRLLVAREKRLNT